MEGIDQNLVVITCSHGDGPETSAIFWHENTDGMGTFQSNVITQGYQNASDPTSVFATDLDGDRDQDILSAASADNKIAWYEPAYALDTS